VTEGFLRVADRLTLTVSLATLKPLDHAANHTTAVREVA